MQTEEGSIYGLMANTGTLRLVEPGGVRDVELKAGASYARTAGVAHNVINANAFEFSFIEIELK